MKSKSLTIFEGPDGAGKTTAARVYASKIGAKYVHFPALPHVGSGLARMYVEAMLPALLGYQHVVFDRSWLSEIPYGTAFRNGQDRLGDASRRMLERLAMRCGAVVVQCNPGWSTIKANYLSRKELELLENEFQLRRVLDLYEDQITQLSTVSYDYTTRELGLGIIDEIDFLRMGCHDVAHNSAGNLDARIIIVGEKFAERKDQDPWYQWPFASFTLQGCSQWLTNQLAAVGCGEGELLWLNADMDLELIHELRPYRVIALGAVAEAELYRHKINAVTVAHPQHHKRFHAKEPYPLLDYL